jgi:hypothetical protein
MKAIQTVYKGYNFRSRLEARWAVFFDALGWKWQYEVEGFKLPSGNYLPDFFFPEIKAYGEVKADIMNDVEFQKCLELSKKQYEGKFGAAYHNIILLEGMPDMKSYRMLVGGEESTDVIFMPDGDKYYPFYYSYDFDETYMGGTTAAVLKARSARFEFGQSGGTV